MSSDHKTLDTVQVQLTPQDALKVMAGYDRRPEPWILMTAGKFGGSEASPKGMVFEIFIDGSNTVETITLNADGTWSATTHVVLGEMP